MANPKYSRKPMSEKELTKRSGMSPNEFKRHRHGHPTFEVETEPQKRTKEYDQYLNEQRRKNGSRHSS